jgi:hypothetical protein
MKKGGNRMPRRRRAARSHKSKKQNSNPSTPAGPGNLTVPRSMPLPTTMTAYLHYDDPIIIRNSAGTLTLGWRYRMNSVFDPDPLFLSAAVPGFNEYAALFAAYRVTNFLWEVELSNREAFPVVAYIVPLNTDPGVNNSGGQALSGNTKGMTHILSAQGGVDKCKFRGQLNLANFFGLAGYNFDDNYNSSVNGNPSVTLYLAVGCSSPAVAVNGLLARVRLTYRVTFNRRQTLLV